ncbi:uncharacterized protein PV09_00441 [Verruconis gallopava]|uniref:Protein FAF1 n=1 Tax=Verruconis gallopava TaxID=253628 RepID=A0A0D2ASA0_9PEZI|nr:uncharacterized protein PV09_00441 [Verruconis gallopava]KIW09568.1 hypothetical protein PV09_00441 [Verruconis gallopava]
MAITIGKRKREVGSSKPRKATQVEESDSSAAEEEARLKAIFRRHFEAQFKPLPESKLHNQSVEVVPDAENENEDDWQGFSSEEESTPVQVVEYNEMKVDRGLDATVSKKELKAFLSGKVPTKAVEGQNKTKRTTEKDDEGDEDDQMNLKNDLALQRLLSESHLLDSTQAQASFEATGKNRLRALDLRMQTLGAKSSVFDGGKMPMNMRKGILAHRAAAENKRRKEAKENGIILEKEKKQKAHAGKRERGVGGPSVGKYKGGMLTLSKRDVRAIEGPKNIKSGGRKKQRR